LGKLNIGINRSASLRRGPSFFAGSFGKKVCILVIRPGTPEATIYLENGSDEFISVTVTRLSISGRMRIQIYLFPEIRLIIFSDIMTDERDGCESPPERSGWISRSGFSATVSA